MIEASPARRELVEAGAGCGKTYSLVSRYIEGLGYDPETGKALKGRHLQPSKILTLTFTEDAANEMKERILKRLQGFGLLDLARQVFEEGRISTFHGYCYRTLKPHLRELGYLESARLLPPRIVRERRLRYLFARLDQYDDQLAILKILSPSDICQLGVDLWFKVLDSHDKSLNEISNELGKFKKSLEFLHRDLKRGSEVVTGQFPELLNSAKANWVQDLNAILQDPTRYRERALNFASGSRKIKEEFPDFVETARNFKSLLEDIGPTALDPSTLDFEIEAYEKIFSFLSQALDGAPKWLDFEALEHEFLNLLNHLSLDQLRERVTAPELLLVDEFQDTSPEQLAILEKISKAETEWYFVGDPKQSIYSFRKADVSVFLGLKSRVTNISLSTNRRSEAGLLTALNEMSSHFLSSARPDHAIPAQNLTAFIDSKSFATPVAARELKRGEKLKFEDLYQDIGEHQKAIPDSTHGVLFLTWSKLFDFAAWLRSQNISFDIAGHEKHLDHFLTHLFAEYLMWAADPNYLRGYLSLKRWWLPPKIENLSLLNEQQASKQSHQDLFSKAPAFNSWQRHLQFFCDLVRAKCWLGGSSWAASMEKLIVDIEDVGLHHSFDLKELALFLKHDPAALESDISDFDDVTKRSRQNLRLMTVHGSKGLEFDCVYLPHLYVRPRQTFGSSIDDGDSLSFNLWLFDQNGHKFPSLHHRSVLRERQIQEDAEMLRLFYVAITRAKKSLNLYIPAPNQDRLQFDGLSLLGISEKRRSYWNSLLHSFWAHNSDQDSVRDLFDWIKSREEEKVEEIPSAIEKEVTWIYPALNAPEMHENIFFRGGVRRYLEIKDTRQRELEASPQVPAKSLEHDFLKSPQSADLGILFHELMERWNGASESLDALAANQNHADRLKQAALKVRQLPELEDYFRCLRDHPEKVFREGELIISSENLMLNGVADAYWFGQNEQVTLIDWKTSFYLAGFADHARLEKILSQLRYYSEAFKSRAQSCRALAIGIEINPTKMAKAQVIFDHQLW